MSAFMGEAEIEIPMEEFFQYLKKHHPYLENVCYGVPRVDKSNETLVVSVAFGTQDISPEDWTEEPKAVREWREIK